MNKSEREKLASIVSVALYDYTSTRQVIYFGEKLLEEFPCIQGDVFDLASIRHIDNFTNILIELIREMSLSDLGVKESDKELYVYSGVDTFEDVWNVCDDYENLSGIPSEDMVERLDSFVDKYDNLRYMIKDSNWKLCVERNISDEKLKGYLLGETIRGD